MSDDEYCDLETLEALLDSEQLDEDEPLQTSTDLNLKQNDQEKGVSEEEIQKFLNEDSEESETNDVTNGQRNDDPKHENADKRQTPESSENVSENPATLALLKEMEEMKKRMEEMQNLLSQHDTKGPETKSSEKPGKLKQENSTSKKNDSSSSKKLTIIPDDGDNIFFNKSETNDKHQKELTAKANVKSEDKIWTSSKKMDDSDSIKSKKSVTSKDLFGDSDSDWDDMDGESKSNLSEQGKSIKNLLRRNESDNSSQKSDFNHENKYNSESNSWNNKISEASRSGVARGKYFQSSNAEMQGEKGSFQCKTSSSDQKKSKDSSDKVIEKTVVEDFSRIRMVNPLVSSSAMKTRMEGKKMISISRIQSKLNTPDLQGNWVTIGVVVGKSHNKTSNAGKTYCIWKLNDLNVLDESVSFFLFGEVYKTHWKLDVGTVIGLLNPSVMDSMEKGKGDPAFTLKSPKQLMILGQSKDLGWCIARTKSGNKCSQFVNKQQGDFCSYHIQAEYKKTSAKRLELHGSITGIRPKSFEKRIFSKTEAYSYGGQTFVPHSGGGKSKKSVSLSKLRENVDSPRRINTLSLHNVSSKPLTSKGKITDDSEHRFMDMLMTPSPGAMNLVAHLKNDNVKKSDLQKSKLGESSAKPQKANIIESVSAKDLIKRHKEEMDRKRMERKRSSEQLSQKKVTSDPLKQVPMLGKGFYGGQDISFSTSPPSREKTSSRDKSKLKAIMMIQNKGGIAKDDPNAIRKEKDEKEVESIKKKLKSSDSSASTNSCSKSTTKKSSSSSSDVDGPPMKRSRLLGNVDLNAAEMKSILKAKSKHKGALAEAEAEREESYFSELEKKERLEEKFKSITSIEINVYSCKQCQYTAQSALPQCKMDNHTIVKTKTKKRFFACKKCKERVCTVTCKWPTDPCKKCGSMNYDKTSMYKEKSGPKLESEILSHRGDEMKFLNSLNHKVYMNTVVDK